MKSLLVAAAIIAVVRCGVSPGGAPYYQLPRVARDLDLVSSNVRILRRMFIMWFKSTNIFLIFEQDHEGLGLYVRMLELAPVGERVADVEDEGQGGADDHYGGDDEVDDVAWPTWVYLLG